jgi:flagellar biosynthesis protein FliR
MLPFLKFNEIEILTFALVLLRVSAFIVSWPVFSVYNVPQISKILFAVLISMLLFPVVDHSLVTAKGLGTEIIWYAGKEVLAGLCLGFLTRLFFFAVSAGGNLIATSAGLANAQLFNPSMGATTTVIEQFYAVIATLLFLAINGHHLFLTGLAESFQAIPVGPAGIDIAVFKESGQLIQAVVEAGIKMSAPVLVAIFIMNVAMGIIGRAVPQINVLVTSMPVNFMTGIVVMMIAIPALVLQLDHDIVEFAEMMFRFMRAM